MSFHDATNFAGPLGQQFELPSLETRRRAPDPSIFHGEALARDAWAERYAPWIVLGFTALFSLFLLMMNLAGQKPGQGMLKDLSDILQFVGEGLGFIFCTRIAIRLYHVTTQLRRALLQKTGERRSPNELAAAHAEAQAARRAFFAWSSLAIAIALYAAGQAVWTSFDVRMPSANVPFPGLYDVGFVTAYIFLLVGTLLLTRRGKAAVGRVRLLLDALAVIGTAVSLSWFFLLAPGIAALSQAPSTGAAVLSIYFPAGDLFLVAVGAFLMFSPLTNRAQQPVFMLLCMGLFFLAITDSLLSYYNLSTGFNTGTLQDVLWPLSMALIGLAAIEYPRSIAREQEQAERTRNVALGVAPQFGTGSLSQISALAQTIAPFILVLATCAVLLTRIASKGGATLIQADLVALTLILIVIARQALTLIENSRLAMQMRGELVISRRELQVTRREADEATRTAQEKQAMDNGIVALREVHARVARGDLAARAPTIVGPLLPIAISLNLMLDRLGAISQRGAKYDQLLHECNLIQEAIERIGQGQTPWPGNQQMPQGASELRSIFMSLAHLQRLQESQWRRAGGTVESMSSLTRRLREALLEFRHSHLFSELSQSSFERMVLDRIIREVDLLEQQQQGMLTQIAGRGEQKSPELHPVEIATNQAPGLSSRHDAALASQPLAARTVSAQQDNHNPYSQRMYQSHHVHMKPIEH